MLLIREREREKEKKLVPDRRLRERERESNATVKLKLATNNLLQCRVPTQAANFQASLSPSEHWNNGAGKK